MTDKNQKTVDDLVTRLKNSTAMQSLTMEQSVAKRLRKLKWDVVHSCYYVDPKESKLREIDVTGKQVWSHQINKDDCSTLRLHTVIECKSAKGFHILFACESRGHTGSIHAQWLGARDSAHRIRLADTLSSLELNRTQINTIINHYNKLAYEDENLPTTKLHINTLPPKFHASAFRETNIGSDKELEASVLWKAGLTLSSVVESFNEEFLFGVMDDIKLASDMTLLYGDGNVVPAIIDELNLRGDLINLYHPIVVIDCALWSVKDSKPKPIQWCRLKQSNLDDFSDWWFDVVSYDYFDQYITELTSFYNSQLMGLGAKLLK